MKTKLRRAGSAGLALLGVALLSGCGGPESNRMGGGKVLKDAEGCAYIARKNLVDTVFLTYSKELSAETCDMKADGM